MQEVSFYALSDSKQVNNKPFTLRILMEGGRNVSMAIKISEEIIKRPRNLMRVLQEAKEKEVRIRAVRKDFLVEVSTKGGKNRDPQHYVLLKRNGLYHIFAPHAVKQVDLAHHKGEAMCLWNKENGARPPPQEVSIWAPKLLCIETNLEPVEEEELALVEYKEPPRTPRSEPPDRYPPWLSETFNSTIRKDLFAGVSASAPEFAALPSTPPLPYLLPVSADLPSCWSHVFRLPYPA